LKIADVGTPPAGPAKPKSLRHKSFCGALGSKRNSGPRINVLSRFVVFLSETAAETATLSTFNGSGPDLQDPFNARIVKSAGQTRPRPQRQTKHLQQVSAWLQLIQQQDRANDANCPRLHSSRSKTRNTLSRSCCNGVLSRPFVCLPHSEDLLPNSVHSGTNWSCFPSFFVSGCASVAGSSICFVFGDIEVSHWGRG